MAPESWPEHQAELEVDWENLGESDSDDDSDEEDDRGLEFELPLSGSDDDLMSGSAPGGAKPSRPSESSGSNSSSSAPPLVL